MSRVAVLYQACEPPVVNGVRKPKKPGGYRDSGADIAYVLGSKNFDILTPQPHPDPMSDEGWCFPDTEAGILSALERGATTLWANTILFGSHPLQTSSSLEKYVGQVKVVGQPPRLVDQYDDKNYVNTFLKSQGTFTMPRSWVVSSSFCPDMDSLPYPVVGKPVRGRGSHGVKLCRDKSELLAHLDALFKESPIVMLEEFLAGEEATVTVMPPSPYMPRYSAMPVVVRFNHEDGIAPYNGVVAVTQNSRALSDAEMQRNPRYDQFSDECERMAESLRVTAPIRVDGRRFTNKKDSRFAAFDVNMKPVSRNPLSPTFLTANPSAS
jgi:hypothetical protein